MEKKILEDLFWASKRHSELLKRYRDKWIGIYDKRVVASGLSGDIVKKEAKAKGLAHVALYYVESGSAIYAYRSVF